MFGNSFYFLFSKTCFGEYKEKTIFLYFLNKKNVWLVEIKKKKNKIENTKICCCQDLNSLNKKDLLN